MQYQQQQYILAQQGHVNSNPAVFRHFMPPRQLNAQSLQQQMQPAFIASQQQLPDPASQLYAQGQQQPHMQQQFVAQQVSISAGPVASQSPPANAMNVGPPPFSQPAASSDHSVSAPVKAKQSKPQQQPEDAKYEDSDSETPAPKRKRGRNARQVHTPKGKRTKSRATTPSTQAPSASPPASTEKAREPKLSWTSQLASKCLDFVEDIMKDARNHTEGRKNLTAAGYDLLLAQMIKEFPGRGITREKLQTRWDRVKQGYRAYLRLAKEVSGTNLDEDIEKDPRREEKTKLRKDAKIIEGFECQIERILSGMGFCQIRVRCCPKYSCVCSLTQIHSLPENT